MNFRPKSNFLNTERKCHILKLFLKKLYCISLMFVVSLISFSKKSFSQCSFSVVGFYVCCDCCCCFYYFFFVDVSISIKQNIHLGWSIQAMFYCLMRLISRLTFSDSVLYFLATVLLEDKQNSYN